MKHLASLPCIRQANPKDGNRVLEIWRKAVDATHHFLFAADRQAIEAEVNAFLPHAPLWLAVDANDHPIGFMLLDGANVEALFVDPAHHGTGAGRALVEHALRLHPTLSTDVNEQNHQAAAFYQHLGFHQTGRSETDSQGRPYPILHLRKQTTSPHPHAATAGHADAVKPLQPTDSS